MGRSVRPGGVRRHCRVRGRPRATDGRLWRGCNAHRPRRPPCTRAGPPVRLISALIVVHPPQEARSKISVVPRCVQLRIALSYRRSYVEVAAVALSGWYLEFDVPTGCLAICSARNSVFLSILKLVYLNTKFQVISLARRVRLLQA